MVVTGIECHLPRLGGVIGVVQASAGAFGVPSDTRGEVTRIQAPECGITVSGEHDRVEVEGGHYRLLQLVVVRQQAVAVVDQRDRVDRRMIGDDGNDVRIPFHVCQQVVRDIGDVVVRPGLDTDESCVIFRNEEELQLIEVGDLLASKTARWHGGGDVAVEAFEQDVVSRLPLHKLVRTRTDDILRSQRLIASLVRDLLRVDARATVDVRQVRRHRGERLIEFHLHRVIIQRSKVGNVRPKGLGCQSIRAPTIERGDDIGRCHLFSVLEEDTVAEVERGNSARAVQLPALSEHRLRGVARIECEQSFQDVSRRDTGGDTTFQLHIKLSRFRGKSATKRSTVLRGVTSY